MSTRTSVGFTILSNATNLPLWPVGTAPADAYQVAVYKSKNPSQTPLETALPTLRDALKSLNVQANLGPLTASAKSAVYVSVKPETETCHGAIPWRFNPETHTLGMPLYHEIKSLIFQENDSPNIKMFVMTAEMTLSQKITSKLIQFEASRAGLEAYAITPLNALAAFAAHDDALGNPHVTVHVLGEYPEWVSNNLGTRIGSITTTWVDYQAGMQLALKTAQEIIGENPRYHIVWNSDVSAKPKYPFDPSHHIHGDHGRSGRTAY